MLENSIMRHTLKKKVSFNDLIEYLLETSCSEQNPYYPVNL